MVAGASVSGDVPTLADAEQAVQSVGQFFNTVVTLDLADIFAQEKPASIAIADLPYPGPADVLRTLAR
jgi:hypothetical protein